eukprot:1180264-Prorocentrum_minimum.AAC.1
MTRFGQPSDWSSRGFFRRSCARGTGRFGSARLSQRRVGCGSRVLRCAPFAPTARRSLPRESLRTLHACEPITSAEGAYSNTVIQ